MKLHQRLVFLLKTAWNDLFGEEGHIANAEADPGAMTSRINETLNAAQKNMETLHAELTRSRVRQQQLAASRQGLLAQIEILNADIDWAVKAKQDERASALLGRVNLLQKDASEIAEMSQACEGHAKDIRLAIDDQQTQIDSLRRRTSLLEERETGLTALNEIFRTQQELAHQTDRLQAQFAAWEEKIARREDQLAARREWSK